MRPPRRATVVLLATLVATACATDDGADTSTDDGTPAAAQLGTDDGPDGAFEPGDEAGDEAEQADDAAAGTTYPLTVRNCDLEIVFDGPPQRVALLNSAALPALDEIGVVDRIVARAGAFPEEYYHDDLNAAIADIESLGGDDLDTSGHFQISQETILDVEPDLVLGLPDGIAREALADAGIPVLVEPNYCPEGAEEPDFTTITDQVLVYGEVFDVTADAEAAVIDLEARVDELLATASELPARSVAVLFPTVGGGAGYAYGNRSMAHPQVEAANLTNVFGDIDERVFEVTLEEVLDRDPDVLILLHVDGEPGPVEDEIRGLPGAEGMTAVRDDAVLVQLFHFTEPPTPLSIEGLERIVEAFGDVG